MGPKGRYSGGAERQAVDEPGMRGHAGVRDRPRLLRPRPHPGRHRAVRVALTRAGTRPPNREDRTMRIVLIGVSHWHTPFYSDPVLEMTDAAIVGVSDPDVARAATLAARAKCPVFADYRNMCTTLRPDFAFVLGRHCDMADAA